MATRSAKIDQKADLIWAIADKLTGVYKPHEYGDVILPLTVIRRFDCILSDTKDAVLQKYDEVKNLPMKDILLRKASKKDFYNTSKYTFERLMDDPDHIEENFREYLNKFSANVRDILEKFKFDGHITTMANKGILYIVLKEYTTDRGNLHPNEISNLEMGYIFEEIIRRFSESHNEDAGQHYTPREVIQLMVNILFYDDNDILSGNNVAKTIYDPACGTGGMLSVAEEYLHSLNASTELVSFGQEINDQTFAICKADMLIKGNNADYIKDGNTLSDDQFAGSTFDYILSNPPFGREWKNEKAKVEEEAKLGFGGRFGAGLPAASDGQMLFLMTAISKMKDIDKGGSRIAIIHNGSPLFTGDAGSGPSEIRRYILENDLLEAIIALPNDIFYNTGIATYIWVLSNKKAGTVREGKVQLINANEMFVKRRKALGNKRNDINSYIQMSRLLSKTDSNHSLPVDYAKSCPYLMSFMKKYKIKEQIEKYYIKHPDEFGSEREQSLLWLNRNKINKYDELPKTNARLEALKEKAFTGGAEKYLWIPPSLPYYEMQGAYKNSKGFSKILVFSAWEMVPRMIGALVSYEAERLTVGKLVHQIKNQDKKNTGYFAEGSRRYPVARLRFNVSNGEVRGMSLFALLYPSKTLSDMYLPIESLNNHESLEVIEKSVRLKLKEKLAIIEEKYGDSGNNKEDARWYYLAPMLMDGVIYAKHWIEDIVWEMNTDEEDTTSEVRSSSKDKRNKGFIAHIDKLRSYLDAPEEIHLGRKPEDLLETLVNMVLGSPAICIYRSNGRSTARATSLAKVFVNNFNLPESTAIIDLAYGRCRDDNSHWQNVLKYCKDGCFQAMIDEYIHMLKETAGFQSDGNQYQIVHDMMMDSLKIHTATYIADTYPDFKKRINGADRKSDGCRIRSSYAVGFTKDAGDNSKVVMRKENIRNAFNSPMRPFVLATTSIGQEGLDFHNYCRVIMHWNLPSNPIDVGRILRTFKIKKNVEVTDNGKIII